VAEFTTVVAVDADVQIPNRPMLPWNRPHPAPIGTGTVGSSAFRIVVDMDKIDYDNIVSLSDDIVEAIAGRVA
jgi:hypothetical protein